MTLLKRSIATLATASVALLALAPAPASALDGPVARNDILKGTSAVVSGNVLTNDTWDAGHTASLTSVTLRKQGWDSPEVNQGGFFDKVSPSCGAVPAPAVTFDAAGVVSVDFGARNCAAFPSMPRWATLDYVFTDTAGQSASAYVIVREYQPTLPIAAADDNITAGQVLNVGGTTNVAVFLNDSYGDSWDYEVEVVTPPAHGQFEPVYGAITPETGPLGQTVYCARDTYGNGCTHAYGQHGFTYKSTYSATDPTITWTRSMFPNPMGGYSYTSQPLTDTFEYRLRLKADNTVVSNTATAALTYTLTKVDTPPPPPVVTNSSAQFYPGGATEYTYTLTAPAGVDTTGATVTENTTGDTDAATVTSLGGNSYKITWNGGITTAKRVTHTLTWRNGGGDVVARAVKDFSYYVEAFAPPNATDDEVWVRVGGHTDFQPLLNDTLNTLPSDPAFPMTLNYDFVKPDGTLFRVSSMGKTVVREVNTSTTSLGSVPTLWSPYIPTAMAYSNGISETANLVYNAGNTPGTDQFTYTLCSRMPADAACDTARVTVHVTPVVAATDDARTARPGDTIAVPVLGNDVYTDIPAQGADVLVLTDVPAGVQARVLNDRNVEVKVPAGFEGNAFDFGYRLTDFTGTTSARVVVNIDRDTPDLPDPEPPVVDPEPEPVVPPKARNDHSKVEVGGKVNVEAFDNDTYQGTGDLLANGWTVEVGNRDRFIKGGKGYTVTATRGGKMTVQVSPAFKGDEIKFGYRLTDDTGEADAAVVTVNVTRPVAVPPIIPAGGVFDLDGIHSGDTTEKGAVAAPAVAAAVAPAPGGQALAMLTGWVLLALVGATAYRRKVSRV